MIRKILLLPVVAVFVLPALAQAPSPDHAWIATSNSFTNMLITIEMAHSPESGSRQGLAEFDTKISQPTLADEDKERAETEAVLAKLKSAVAEQKEKEVAQDLRIVIRRVELDFKSQDFFAPMKFRFSTPAAWCLVAFTLCLMSKLQLNGVRPRSSGFANTPDWTPITNPSRKF